MFKDMTDEEVCEIRSRYHYLMGARGDPGEPLDPLAYVDSTGDRLLHIAAALGDVRTVDLLLKAGQDVNARGDMGCSALHYARMYTKEDVADLLLLNGADASLIDDFGRTPDQH
ncbi:ankyrin repeat domain-containing protein [Bacillus sp. NP157]|nr:ankyrin repeat domain-containing protein [Bacillus sp. NP157]